MAPKSIKLYYFDARGRGELCRLILAYGGIEYEDIRVSGAEWQELKPNSPFSGMPYLDVDGVLLGQSISIARYLAKLACIAGKNEIEQAQADAFVDYGLDYFSEIGKVRFTKGAEDKEKGAKDFLQNFVPKFCNKLQDKLEKNGGTYFVGNALTYADIMIAMLLDFLVCSNEKAFADVSGVDDRFDLLKNKFPLLDKHRLMVDNLPNIKAWIEKRPKTSL